jgi:hypothetical protein
MFLNAFSAWVAAGTARECRGKGVPVLQEQARRYGNQDQRTGSVCCQADLAGQQCESSGAQAWRNFLTELERVQWQLEPLIVVV